MEDWNEWSEKIREESTYRKYSIKMKRGWKCNLQDNKNVKIFKIHATIVNNERIERDRKISIYIYIYSHPNNNLSKSWREIKESNNIYVSHEAYLGE